jgi:CheY-like chemotaxis protein
VPGEEATPAATWNVLLVEDEETVRRQVKEFFDGQHFAGRRMQISEFNKLDDAINVISERKADLIILDVYSGPAQAGGEMIGLKILERIKESGFVPVILYTALPGGLENEIGLFVRLVGKDVGGLGKLKSEIEDLFLKRIPQVHRAIVNHLDQTLRSYMWQFVEEHWEEFSSFLDKPEFLRLIIQRLARSFTRDGIGRMSEEVYGAPPAEDASGDTVHPAEYYIKPPIGSDPKFGDLRVREVEGEKQYLVVLWPSCDMVDDPPKRTPKTRKVLCARAIPTQDCPIVADWLAAPSNTKRDPVEKLVKNTCDRFHFLPGVWDIPHTIVDFQVLEHVPLEDVKNYVCLGTIDSPFAESLGARFQRYVNRIGTPDLELSDIMALIEDQ